MTMKTTLTFLLFLNVLVWAQAVEAQQAKAKTKTVELVFIAGPNDHCGDNPCHKYIEDLSLLKKCLEALKRPAKFEVQLYIGERPKLGDLDNVSAVIVHSSADRSMDEWHALFPQNDGAKDYDDEYLDFLRYFDEQMARGMGLMLMHYSTWVDHPEAQKRLLDWIGGHYLKGKSKVDGDKSTKGTTAMETVEFVNPGHSILNGLKPWTSEAEYYYNIHFRENDPRFTHLLSSRLPLDSPEPHTVAWCVERDDGGRGVGFTGAHNPDNMYLDDFRTFVLNAIVWTAKVKVPRKGIRSTVPKK